MKLPKTVVAILAAAAFVCDAAAAPAKGNGTVERALDIVSKYMYGPARNTHRGQAALHGRRDQVDVTTDTEVYFTFELGVEGICSDGGGDAEETATAMTPDTKARLEDGCLDWVREMAQLDRDELETRNDKRGEGGNDDFLDLFLIEDLDVRTMVLTDFEDGASCEEVDAGYRRLQRRQESLGLLNAKAICKKCRRKTKEERVLRLFAGEDDPSGSRGTNRMYRRLGGGNLTNSLIDVGFEDARDVTFSNFRLKDCSGSSSDCSGSSGGFSCCGFEGCACKHVSQTLCFEEQCSADGLCCNPDPFSEAPFLYPQCAESDACTATSSSPVSQGAYASYSALFFGWSLLVCIILG